MDTHTQLCYRPALCYGESLGTASLSQAGILISLTKDQPIEDEGMPE